MKLGFTGPFADANFGDYGMLVNNLHAIPDAQQISLYSYDTRVVDKVLAEYLPHSQMESKAVVFDKAKRDLLTKNGRHPTPLEILNAVSNIEDLFSSIENLDRMVVNGGGYWNELWCQPHRLPKLLSILAPILIAQTLGKPITFTANGFGPFGSSSAFLTDIFPALNASFHVRDTVSSAAELRRLGIPDSSITYTPDDLFFYASSLVDRPSGISPRARPHIVLETYMPVAKLTEIRPQLASFDLAMKNRGIDVVVLPFYSGRGGAEQAAWLGREFGWITFDFGERDFLRLEDARELIRTAELVVCERYHAAVVALANRVPVLHSLRDVSGDKRYYYSKSLGASYTAWGDQSVGSLHASMALEFEEALARAEGEYEKVRSEQIRMHESVPASTRGHFRQLRQNLITEIGSA
ncbi:MULTISPECIES: polysaccharide pyruvyl transferase family protein [unclassified Dietzia]|uniref:polysaccharide pyruvyl transferase family protein n=1 Tax=unclassified Dietzia TaxID=2617939 RepID=UPI0015F87819|nr:MULTISPECIES: polysaccharide pyruvyl transferase family protein [unclassified Dietzia]MBB1023685.1 polysaccharide pyruvyl transferase family protein [Dietzia sp. DQ12-76]MBB1027245.1 polysaccharide pyruvyl transferase family protein [Dietzia sp. DQ11-38-2]